MAKNYKLQIRGSMPWSRIYEGHWVTRLALSYEVDTSGMFSIPIRDVGSTALGKMWVLVLRVGGSARNTSWDTDDYNEEGTIEDYQNRDWADEKCWRAGSFWHIAVLKSGNPRDSSN
uniref:Uncharacterized protein n=1 Tax=Lactuca sativa TaxID=4236 RepID=A0A9R1X0J5_LACSA|nr:hypothetical protein LSAT_V11C800442240 [Lactuca sativa]